ncbi:site-specific recombinase XerD [Parabacteroides sp. PFB2-10]|uniref:site-specific integrase n=1 Tax=Parabacteroides sp. PFB2-10 TaxID=1742405 RepID=UPI0024757148|nr:site-specific integrase [Parabacteroides sp. PFB2-10]MDH6312825.1 site-specific recombinase XerD [Parabacteroides sp. PFB2-10]MDL2208420.1 site-specific integrase [Parabacteroides sp. OttesenSCG-928-O15]
MSSSFKILFYIKKNQVNKNGKCTIMVRLSINGTRTQFSSKLEIEPELWDTNAGRGKGKSTTILRLNHLLNDIRTSLTTTYYDVEKKEHVTGEKIRNIFLGYTTEQQTLLTVFAEHNVEVKKMVGIGKTKATLEKYERTYNRLKDYLETRHRVSDISLREINHSFITGFETYLRVDCRCNENTTAKFMQFFKRIVIIARNNGWIVGDPFANYKIRIKRVDRGYLTEDELHEIIKKNMTSERLEHVRDIFIFSCYTGLAYIDVKNLKEENIRKSFDGSLWIMTKRQKTSTTVNVPLLKIPSMILKKYKGKLKNGQLLPVLSNQKTNSYLKEIADLCGIEKNLTFHLARHTFATTTTLAKGVPIETVSKMLGHTNISTTQIYARITNSKISEDMKVLAKKMKGAEKMYEEINTVNQ